MRILIVKEKHGDYYYDVSTDELLHKVCCKILKSRLDEGWYGKNELISDTYVKDKLGLSEKEIRALPEGVIKIEALADLDMTRQQEKDIRCCHSFIKDVEQCLKTPYDPNAKQGKRMWAWGLLQGRSKHEYEYVELDKTIDIKDMD